jgi:hypothetical protein
MRNELNDFFLTQVNNGYIPNIMYTYYFSTSASFDPPTYNAHTPAIKTALPSTPRLALYDNGLTTGLRATAKHNISNNHTL